jgi:NTE family protein
VNITLALGGGGSKGYSHIGVIRALEREGFNICGVAGTSAGGVAAVIFAAGYSPEKIIEMAGNIQQDSLFRFGRGHSLLGTKGIRQALETFLSQETFADLKIPCAVTAVDINNKEEVILQRGLVLDALMAAIAIPGIFPPISLDDKLLVDGVVSNPVPVEVARSLAPSLPVIAVPLLPEPDHWKEVSPWGISPNNPLLRPISRLRIAQAFEVYLQSMDMTSHTLGEIRLKLENPDLIIRPKVDQIGHLDKVDPREVAALGEQAVVDSRKAIDQLLGRS